MTGHVQLDRLPAVYFRPYLRIVAWHCLDILHQDCGNKHYSDSKPHTLMDGRSVMCLGCCSPLKTPFDLCLPFYPNSDLAVIWSLSSLNGQRLVLCKTKTPSWILESCQNFRGKVAATASSHQAELALTAMRSLSTEPPPGGSRWSGRRWGMRRR